MPGTDGTGLAPGAQPGIYSRANGVGQPASLPPSTAVQASACLRGAFAARRLPTAPHAFRGGAAGTPAHDDLVLADGGVYDNMDYTVTVSDLAAR